MFNAQAQRLGRGASIQDIHQQQLAAVLQNVSATVVSPLTQLVPSEIYSYDANDRLQGGGRAYDLNGNLTAENGNTYGYDSGNRLVSVNNGQIRYVYDGDGTLVQKIENGVACTYLWDDLNPTGRAQAVEEHINGTLAKVNTFGHSRISSDRANPDGTWAREWYGSDGHGNVRFLTNDSGEVTDTYEYDAFGILLGHSGTSTNDNLYCGEKLELSTGLYNLRARIMEPATGRFLTMDSYEGDPSDAAGLHKYLYASADPANLLDPSGHLSLAELQVTMAKISGLVLVSAPALNRAGVFVVEALTGESMILPGANYAGRATGEAIREIKIAGGISTLLRAARGNASGKIIGTIKDLAKVRKAGEQANHLNVKAVYETIKDEDAVGILLDGYASVRNTQHWKFHEAMEAFWDSFREFTRAGERGARFGKTPTNAQYGEAMVKALEAADIDPQSAASLGEMAKASREAHGFLDMLPVPCIPKPVPGH